MSINILDSLLWEVALREEFEVRLEDNESEIAVIDSEIEAKNKEKACELRKNTTRQEKKLWYDYLRTYPIKFYRQRPIDNYIVDFYCSKAKLIIEIDGLQHYTASGIE